MYLYTLKNINPYDRVYIIYKIRYCNWLSTISSGMQLWKKVTSIEDCANRYDNIVPADTILNIDKITDFHATTDMSSSDTDELSKTDYYNLDTPTFESFNEMDNDYICEEMELVDAAYEDRHILYKINKKDKSIKNNINEEIMSGDSTEYFSCSVHSQDHKVPNSYLYDDNYSKSMSTNLT